MSDLDLITIVDTETTGFRNTDLVVEVAAIFYSLVHAAPVATMSTLIPVKYPPPSTLAGLSAEEVHGISQDLAAKADAFTNSPASAMLNDMLDRSGAILAHGAPFDKRMLKVTNTVYVELLEEKKWVCTMDNIHWPRKHSGKSLQVIALTHGVPIVTAHRALADCDIIARLLTKVWELGYDLVELVSQAMEPHILVQAMVSKESKDLAATRGFHFEREPAPRWVKIVRETDFRKDATLGYPFTCIEVKPA